MLLVISYYWLNKNFRTSRKWSPASHVRIKTIWTTTNVTVGTDLNKFSEAIRLEEMQNTQSGRGFYFIFLSRHAYSWKSCWERGLWYLSNHRRKERLWKLAGGWQKQDDKALTVGLTWLCLCLRIKELVLLLLSQLASKAVVFQYFSSISKSTINTSVVPTVELNHF